MAYLRPAVTGRPLTPESLARIRKLLAIVAKKPGISNVAVAYRLEMGTLKCSVLGKRLEQQGFLEIRRSEDGGLLYYPGKNA
jgi:hypothetical protein